MKQAESILSATNFGVATGQFVASCTILFFFSRFSPLASRLSPLSKKNRPTTFEKVVDRLYRMLWSVGGKMEPLGETRKSQRATAQAFV